jgi:DNA-binding Lrp family transcriptional regulator
MGRDWEKEVRDYLASGKTQSEFARERGLSTSDLSTRLKRARKSVGSVGFVAVGNPERIELEVSGVLIRVQAKDLPLLLRSLT